MAEVLSGVNAPLTRDGVTGAYSSAAILCGVLAAIFLAQLACCVWALGRGFDITDEAYLLLMAMHPQVYTIVATAAHWITSELWSITGSLYGFRASGLLILMAGALVLAWGTLRISGQCGLALPSTAQSRIAVATSALIATLHAATYGSAVFFTPSYNVIASTCTYGAIGLTFLALSCDGKRSFFFHMLAGVSLALVFLCKFPAGIDSLIMTQLIILGLGTGRRRRIAGALLTLAAMAAAALLIILCHMPFADAAANFRLSLVLGKDVALEPGYQALKDSIFGRLLHNAGELLDSWLSCVMQFALPLICFALYAFMRRKAIAVAGIASLLLLLAFRGYLLAGMPQLDAQITSLTALMLLLLLAAAPVWTRERKTVILSGVLIFLPYCVAIGTGNQLPPQILISLAPWGLLFALLALERTQACMPALALCGIFAFTGAAQVIAGMFYPAYHMSASLAEQTEPVSIPGIGEVRVDGGIRDFISGMASAAKKCAIGPGRGMLGLYNIPGAAVAVEAIPLLTPWLYGPKAAEPWLHAAPPWQLRASVVALQLLPDGSMPPVSKMLGNFPAHYRLCGTAFYPYQQQKIQLWMPEP